MGTCGSCHLGHPSTHWFVSLFVSLVETYAYVEPGTHHPVPLGFTDGKLFIRPDNPDYDWTKEDAIDLKQLPELEWDVVNEVQGIQLFVQQHLLSLQTAQEKKKQKQIIRCPSEDRGDHDCFHTVLNVTKATDFAG